MTESTLADLCLQVTDGTHDSPRLLPQGVPFIKGKHINKGFVDFENCDYISYEDHLKVIARSKPEQGDILFANIGNSIGDTAFVATTKPFSIKNVALFKPDPKKVNCRYLYYHVISRSFQDALLAKKSGSAQPFVGLETLRNHKIIHHEHLAEQDRIASILSAYDDLIENNTRRIKILEEMAQMLYREWFINFRFPGHEKMRLVESELGPIPEGWRVEPLGENLTVLETGNRPKGGVGEISRGVPSLGAESILGVGRFDYGKTKYVPIEYFRRMRQGILQDRDVLVYKDGGQPGNFHPHVSLVGEGFPFLRMVINSHVYRLRGTHRITQDFLYFHLSSENMLEWMRHHGTGSAIPGLARKDLIQLPLILPPRETLERFDDFVKPITSFILVTAKRNQALGTTRDLLLPKLISGEIPVEAADEAAAELAEQSV